MECTRRRTGWVVFFALLALPSANFAGTQVLSNGALVVEIKTATDAHVAAFGPRFDRTAMVTSITVDGVEVLGPWGLCDEFGLYGVGVLGYETAAIGEPFVKIGVGTLLRDTADSYHFSRAYPIEALYQVSVESDGQKLEVRQHAEHTQPHRYDYLKTYTVSEGNTLTIDYQLTNTGQGEWPFEHYNHHWFRVHDIEIGRRYRAGTGFDLPGAETNFLLAPTSREVGLATTLRSGDAAYYAAELGGVDAAQNTFELWVDDTRIVRYQGSFKPARFAVYANEEGFCPEVFMRATLQPGETANWSATYRFLKPNPGAR